jgi:two-component system response regulator MprA
MWLGLGVIAGHGRARVAPRRIAGEPRDVCDPQGMGERILVVDDDAPVRRMLARTLEAEGHQVTTVADGGRALAEVERSAPDAVILDVAMPGMDGLAVCRRLRDKGLATPILLLTARDSVTDRVRGLDAGADDYLVKPFALPELTARLRALVRRGQPPAAQLAAADLTLDLTRRVVTRDGREIELTEREAALLALLMRHPRTVVSREMAIDHVWEEAVSENVVDTYVGYVRRKLGEPPVIHTVRGVGFTLRR